MKSNYFLQKTKGLLGVLTLLVGITVAPQFFAHDCNNHEQNVSTQITDDLSIKNNALSKHWAVTKNTSIGNQLFKPKVRQANKQLAHLYGVNSTKQISIATNGGGANAPNLYFKNMKTNLLLT